jgi:PKD repeat protein
MSRPTARLLCVCVTLLLSLSFGAGPAAAQVDLLPGDTAVGAAIGSQSAPVIAEGDGKFLAVWQDLRTSPFVGPPFATEGRGVDIYARRLDAGGAPLDTEPFVVATAFGDQTVPRVSWNGQSWLVAWGGPNSTQWNHKISAVRIVSDGSVLDAPAITLHTTAYKSNFELASNGDEWLIVTQSTGAGEADLRGLRVSAAGVLLNPGGTQLIPSSNSLFSFKVASAEGEYLLLWGNSAVAPRGQRFDGSLAPLGDPFPTNGIEVASNGTEYFLVWVVDDTYWDDFVFGQRLSPDGFAGPVLTIAGQGGGLPLWNPAQVDVGWDGGQWWVSWLEITRGAVFSRVAPDGTVLDFGGLAVDPGAPDRAVQALAVAGSATGGAQFVLQDGRATASAQFDILAAAVDAEGLADPVSTVSTSARAQIGVDLAVGAGEVLTVFLSELSGSRRIVAQRLGLDGVPLDLNPFEIASGPDLGTPRVGFDGFRYLVVWSENDQILGRRVASNGTVIDTAPLTIMTGRSPDVTGQGGTFLVVGTRPTISVHFFHPFSMRVRGNDGATLDPEPVILGQYFARNPRVTTFAGRWLATWQRNISHDDPQAYLMAAFIEPDGTTPGEFLYAFYGGTPDVAASAGRALFVWRSNSPAAANNDVLGRIMLADGTLSTATFVISDALDKQLNPSVAWNGSEFVVAWEDKRNAVIYFDERTEVFAARVSEAGVLDDPDGFAFGDAARPEILPAVAGVGGGTLIAASSFRDAPAFQAYRIAYQLLGNDNIRPVAVASGSPDSGEVPLTVAFSAAGSHDPDGWIDSYAWNFGDGNFGTVASPSHDYTLPGEFLATLTVTDNEGASTSNVVPIVVSPVNQAPVAIATADPSSGAAPLAVMFESAGSYDPDDGIASIVWDFGDGSSLYYGGTAYHTYSAPGTYTTTLTVTDHSDVSALDTVNVDVGATIQPPQAIAAANPQSGISPLTVTFDASGSSDLDGTIAGYRWEFGDAGVSTSADGGVSTQPNPTHVYEVGGLYVATLTVTDNDGASSTDSVTIDVVDGDVTSVATADFETQWGAMTAGSYLDTDLADGIYQALTEAESGGKPSLRHSRLSHTWSFDVFPGPYHVFYVDAHHTPNAEGDHFVFEYSRDGVAYAPMVVVGVTAPGGGLRSFAFAEDVSGRLYVRVTDSDRSPGNKTADTLYVDEMFVVTSWQSTEPPPAATTVYVASVVVDSVKALRGASHARAEVTLRDDQGRPVAGAVVAGSFSGDLGGAQSAATDANGIAVLTTAGSMKGKLVVTFCVDDVSDPALTYDPGANTQSCATSGAGA